MTNIKTNEVRVKVRVNKVEGENPIKPIKYFIGSIPLIIFSFSAKGKLTGYAEPALKTSKV